MSYWLVVVLVIAIAVGRMRSRGALVLGREMAHGQARDDEHRERIGDVPSPMQGLDYGPDEQSLIDPVSNDADRRIGALCERFTNATPDEHEALRDAIHGDEMYALLQFARRASVFAMREQDDASIRRALAAVAMTDAERIDYRDVPMTLGVVHYAAFRIGANVPELFNAAAALANGSNEETIRSFARKQKSGDVTSWGYFAVEGRGGHGFASAGLDRYRPALDLFAIALPLLDIIRRDRYAGDITVGSDLPPVWFPVEVREEAGRMLKRSPGGITIHASMREAQEQILLRDALRETLRNE
ncbi:MAG TPA: hypothetical protein VHW00_19800 [Thermoanaerobaculia bacterium]|nr:hypothetical protein [Thermoanaerobaculia bacterium]